MYIIGQCHYVMLINTLRFIFFVVTNRSGLIKKMFPTAVPPRGGNGQHHGTKMMLNCSDDLSLVLLERKIQERQVIKVVYLLVI